MEKFLGRCIKFIDPSGFSSTPVELFNQRIDRRPATHAPGDEEEKDQGYSYELGPGVMGRSPLLGVKISISYFHGITFLDSAARLAQP